MTVNQDYSCNDITQTYMHTRKRERVRKRATEREREEVNIITLMVISVHGGKELIRQTN